MTRRLAYIERVKERLRQVGTPRLEMSLIMLLTAGTGFLVAFIALQLGLVRMAIRYPLAVLCAYGAFLLYLWRWLDYRRRRMEDPAPQQEPGGSADGLDASWLDLPGDLSLPSLGSSGAADADFSGTGGSFGGGGASGDFDAPGVSRVVGGSALPPPISGPAPRQTGMGSFISDLDIDDDFGKALIVLLIAVVILFLTGYIIYIAPGLLAEVMVDGMLVSGLYRHLKKEDRRHWLATALRKTWWYFLAVALLLMIAGALMQSWYPEARSIGDVWQAFNAGP